MKINKPYTNKQYAELAIYCNKNNSKIEDKGDYLEAVLIPAVIPTLNELKEQKLQELDSKCKDYIYSIYSSEKQKNIDSELLIAYINNSEDLEIRKLKSKKMRDFIDLQRLICSKKKQEIESAKTEKKLIEIDVNFGE